MAVNGADPYELLAQLCVLSDSQEELLRCCSFAGNPNSVAVGGGGSASSDSQFLPTHPSLPERSEQREQLSPNHAHHPPPEQSVRHHPMDAAAAPGADEVNAEDGCVCDVAAGVDLGKNPDLGFPLEVQSQQIVIETEIEIIGGVRIAESECGREESAPVVVNLDLGDSNGEEICCTNKKRKLGDEKLGNFQETRCLDPWRRNLNASKENEDNDSGNLSVLEILKVVAEKENGELEEDLGNRNILEIVSDRGMAFPRPCWWPEGEDFEFK